jgi:aspartate ammonia-lyase
MSTTEANSNEAEVRQEKDLLGTLEIPADVYYGIQTLRAVENFPITGQHLPEVMIRSVAMVKQAAAEANDVTGYLDKEKATAISRAAQELIDGELHEQIVVDPIQGGAGTSINMNANEVIANRAIELMGGEKGDYSVLSPNTHVNMSQSTNDVFPTALRLAVLFESKYLQVELRRLETALRDKAAEFNDVLKMGRTHLQDAVPLMLGQEFTAYANVIDRCIARIDRAVQSMKEINMGATAVGTGLNADPAYIKEVTTRLSSISGFSLSSTQNLVDGTQNTDAFLEVSSSLKILATNLSKIANDLRLLTSGPRCGLNEINLPEVQPGSSIMPGKVNPVMAEVVNQVCFQVIGNDHTITLAVEAGQLELNVMEPIISFNLLQSFEFMTHLVQVFIDKCIRGITANAEHTRDMVEHSIGLVTALSPYLSYEQASEVAREALKTGKTVREIVVERELMSPEDLDDILAPESMTEPGIAASHIFERMRKEQEEERS